MDILKVITFFYHFLKNVIMLYIRCITPSRFH